MRTTLLVLLILVWSCSCSSGEPKNTKRRAASSFATPTSLLAGYREFDLLSAPVEPGVRVSTLAHVSWGYSDCTMTVAPEVQPFFLDSLLRDDGQGNLTGEGTNTGTEAARFAALVSCKATDGQEPAEGIVQWPDLIVDGGVDAP